MFASVVTILLWFVGILILVPLLLAVLVYIFPQSMVRLLVGVWTKLFYKLEIFDQHHVPEQAARSWSPITFLGLMEFFMMLINRRLVSNHGLCGKLQQSRHAIPGQCLAFHSNWVWSEIDRAGHSYGPTGSQRR